jgi:DNA processing protein
MVNILALSVLCPKYIYARPSQNRTAPGIRTVCDQLRNLPQAPSGTELKAILKAYFDSKRYASALSVLSRKLPVAIGKWSKLTEQGAWLIDYWHPCYPAPLKDLEAPPFVLYGLGQLPAKTGPWLSVVGTRKPNRYGAQATKSVLINAKHPPQVLVSGLAMGIDSVAHVSSLQRNIINVAVTATDLDGALHASSSYIAREIIRQRGCLITEAHPGADVYPSSFPWRNRIIAALGDALWVVQGTARSGTRSTASHAQDLGRELVATPGDVFCELSEVPIWLLQNGATPLASPGDLDTLVHRVSAKTF